MKKTILSAGLALMAMAVLPSCGGDKSENKSASRSKNTTAAPQATQAASTGAVPNFRFIDADTIGLKYNLAIDFNEQMVKMQSNLEEEQKKQGNALQQQYAAWQTKMQNAQSQAEADKVKGEVESIQNQQAAAEKKISQMAADMEKTIGNNAKIMQDSITNFLRDFAQQNGYDAIIVNTAAPYYNPSLDVTAEVLEGLNARYNKKKK